MLLPNESKSYESLLQYVVSSTARMAMMLLGATVTSMLFYSFNLGSCNILIIYTLAVLGLSAIADGFWLYVISAFLAVVAYNYLFVQPLYCLWGCEKDYVIPFLVMLSAALIGWALASRARRSAAAVARQAERTQVLLDTSRKLQSAENEPQIMSSTAQQLIKLLGRTVIFCSCDGSVEGTSVFPAERDGFLRRYFEPQEREAAVQVWKSGISIATERCLYLPIQGRHRVLGVVGVAMRGTASDLPDTAERSLLDAILCECSLALEREHVVRASNEITLQAQREKLCADLLRAISHDLRTPLTGIAGSASMLIEDEKHLSQSKKMKMYTNIYDEAMWLHTLVENLLAVSRIDDGHIQLHGEPELMEEIINEALSHISRRSEGFQISVDIQGDFLMARMDPRLIVQTLINLLENAMKYTPLGAKIAISVHQEKKMLVVEVADDGPGVPDAEKERLFDRFYIGGTAGRDGRRGLGLGLALCKSIITAHKGVIYIRDNVPHGAIFGFTLQAEEVDYRAQTQDTYSGG